MKAFIKKQKMLLILAAIFLVVLSFFFLRNREAKALAQKTSALQKEIAALPEPLAHRGLLKMDTNFAWIHSITDFLRDLTKWARERSIVIVSIEPGEPKRQDGYIEHPVKVAIKGRFRSIGNYLGFLEALPRPIQVTGFHLANASDTAPELLARLELVLYIRETI